MNKTITIWLFKKKLVHFGKYNYKILILLTGYHLHSRVDLKPNC